MRVLITLARILLGLMFVVFGLNGFLHFLPQPPMPSGDAANFLTALGHSQFMFVVFLLELLGGFLLIINRYVPMGLTLLAPVIVCIVLFHITMAPQGILPGALAAVLWMITYMGVRWAFAGIYHPSGADTHKLTNLESRVHHRPTPTS